ncbi:MAG: hypothetical protein ACI4S2_00300 [Lachnospiraceae bacterium]
MKKRILAMMMAATMTVAMAGCGNSASKDSEQSSVPVSQSTTTDNNKAPGEKTVETLTEVLNENDYSIWFVTNDVDKNNRPDVMILYKDGTYISCSSDGESGTGKRLGDYAQMTDEEILSLVEDTWKSNIDSKAQNSLDDEYRSIASQLGYQYYGEYYVTRDEQALQDTLKAAFYEYSEPFVYGADPVIFEDLECFYGSFMMDWLNEHPEQAQKLLDEGIEPDWNEISNAYITEASAACDASFAEIDGNQEEAAYDKGAYTVSVWTDASGNRVEKETVYFSDGGQKELKGYVSAQPVYDSYYGGYVIQHDNVYITRISPSIRFEFDAIGTEGVNVDKAVSPEGSSEGTATAETAAE